MMERIVTAEELLNTYYEGLSKKKDWDSVLSDDFKFIGGHMTNTEPVVGKMAYVGIINRFSHVFKSMRVKEMILEGEKACVIGNYDYVFPNGVVMNGDVAEIWKIKDGKLDSLTIFFDTLTFDVNSK